MELCDANDYLLQRSTKLTCAWSKSKNWEAKRIYLDRTKISSGLSLINNNKNIFILLSHAFYSYSTLFSKPCHIKFF